MSDLAHLHLYREAYHRAVPHTHTREAPPSFPVVARDGLRSDEPGANASKGVTAGERPGTVSREGASEVSPTRPSEIGGHESPRGNLVSATEKPLGVTVGGDESGTAARWVSHGAAEGISRSGGECGSIPRPAPNSRAAAHGRGSP